MRKLAYLIVITIICTNFVSAQPVGNVLKCSDETFESLRQVSASVASKGEILLSVTTHQDLGWIDEVEKCIIMRDTLWLTPYLQRLRNDPGFRMDIEQTSIIMEYLHRHPDKKQEIQQGIDEGRILIGATYNQPYEEMFSGESLVRQLYLGKKWLSDNFNGYNSDTYYNADVPGRTLQMSQILAKSGVKNMFVSRHEKGVFDWYSPDNSKVTMFSSGHYIEFYRILSLGNDEALAAMAADVLFWADYYDENSKKVIIPALLNYEFIWDQKPVENCDPFMQLWNGIRYIENSKGERMAVKLPPINYGNLNVCLNAIREHSPKIKSISGERPAVWLYIHGPSHHHAISASREADILLPDAEKFSAINALIEGNFRNYREAKFNETWQDKIYPDHGWGGKGGDITDRLFLSKFVKAQSDATVLLSDALHRIASRIDFRQPGTPVVVFNGLNWERNDPLSIECAFDKGEAFGIALTDASGNPIKTQMGNALRYDDGSLRSCRVLFMAEGIPSVGYSTYFMKTEGPKQEEPSLSFNPDFENRFFAVRFGKGGIERLYDKTLGADILETSKFNLGEVFTMRSEGNGAGEFAEIQKPTMEGFDSTGDYTTAWEKVAEGPVFTSFRFRQPVRHAVVEQTVIFYHQKKQVDFNIDLKNWEGVLYREFRAAFPLNMKAPKITYEVPFGVVEIGRDELPGPAGERYTTDNRLIHPRAQVDWVNVSDERFGVTLSSSVVAFDHIDPTPDPSEATLIQPILMASRKSCHWEGNEYLQHGDHHFSFSLHIHEPGWQNGFREGKQGRHKLYAVTGPVKAADGRLPQRQSFFNIDDDLTYISAIKKSESGEGLIIRMVEMEGKQKDVALEMFTPVTGLQKTNLIELEDIDMLKSGKSLRLSIGNNAIETFRLRYR
jgi:alpha-mannosidase